MKILKQNEDQEQLENQGDFRNYSENFAILAKCQRSGIFAIIAKFHCVAKFCTDCPLPTKVYSKFIKKSFCFCFNYFYFYFYKKKLYLKKNVLFLFLLLFFIY